MSIWSVQGKVVISNKSESKLVQPKAEYQSNPHLVKTTWFKWISQVFLDDARHGPTQGKTMPHWWRMNLQIR